MNHRFRRIVPGLAAAIVLVMSPLASASGYSGEIISYGSCGASPGCELLAQTLDGVVSGSIPLPDGNQVGLSPKGSTIASNGSIVTSGQAAGGALAPVTLLRPDGQLTVLDSTPQEFDASISYNGSKVTFARLNGDPTGMTCTRTSMWSTQTGPT